MWLTINLQAQDFFFLEVSCYKCKKGILMSCLLTVNLCINVTQLLYVCNRGFKREFSILE